MDSVKSSANFEEEEEEYLHKLKQTIDDILNRDPDQHKQTIDALQRLRREMKMEIEAMTSVPKYLTFLRPFYGTLKEHFETVEDSDVKVLLADLLSFLAMSMSEQGEREILKYRLLGSADDIHSWGYEYVSNLAREILEDYADADEDGKEESNGLLLEEQVIRFYMERNSGPEAIDLILELEVEDFGILDAYMNGTNFKRTCLYLTEAARYAPSCIQKNSFQRDQLCINKACELYIIFHEYTSALRVSLFSNRSKKYVKNIFTSCSDLLSKKQLCYILAQHAMPFEVDDSMVVDEDDRKELQDIINNSKLIEGYLHLADDIGVMEFKTPEVVYKVHLLRERAGAAVDSDREKLAATYVIAFVNAGFGLDMSMIVPSGNWVLENLGPAKTSAVASLGMIFLWDIDSGRAQLHEYIYSEDRYAIGGALLGFGIMTSYITNGHDPTLALLRNYVHQQDQSVKISAIMGLGLAFAYTKNTRAKEILAPILEDSKAPLDVVAFAAISLGLIYTTKMDAEVAAAILFQLRHRDETELLHPLCKFLTVGLGLLYLGMQYDCWETVEEDLSSLNEKIGKHCQQTVISCAYAGSGNDLVLQVLLDDLNGTETHVGPAVLGIAMIAMAEEVGLEMAIRLLERLLQYGKQNVRRAVPLALALLCISNPKVNVVNTLSGLSHDDDLAVAKVAILGLGLIGAGTNNARIGRLLRDLAIFYGTAGGEDVLFCVRIAQGLLNIGKGLLTLTPYHSDRLLLQPRAMAGLIIVLHACLEMEEIILGNYHFVLYLLVLAMQPRMLMTVDENLMPLSVPVRVGQAVDSAVVGQPKTIIHFQTFSTPVLLHAGQRAELATEKYVSLTPSLEGFVILKENPY